MSPSIKILWRGITFEAGSRKELDQVLDAIQARESQVPHGIVHSRVERTNIFTALAVMRAMLEAERPLPADQVAAIAGVRRASALGSVSTVWRHALQEFGFTLDDVFRRERDALRRYWGPGPRFREALGVLEQACSDEGDA